MYDWVLVSHFWVPQPDSLSEISLILLPALATCPTFTWMLALFKCWKCGCSESEMQQPSEFWEFVCEGSWNLFPHCLWKADMCIIPMEKYKKAFATVSFADCHNISVAMWSLELRGVVMFESGPFPASFSVAEIWSLSKKTEILQKMERFAS